MDQLSPLSRFSLLLPIIKCPITGKDRVIFSTWEALELNFDRLRTETRKKGGWSGSLQRDDSEDGTSLLDM